MASKPFLGNGQYTVVSSQFGINWLCCEFRPRFVCSAMRVCLLIILASLSGIAAVCIPSCQRVGGGLETCNQRAGSFSCVHLEGHQGCQCSGCSCLDNLIHPLHVPVKICRKFRDSSSCQKNGAACKWWKLGNMCIGKNEQPVVVSCAPLTSVSACMGPNVGANTIAGTFSHAHAPG